MRKPGYHKPPRWDVSHPGLLRARVKAQAKNKRPVTMYSSDYHAFERDVLNGNKDIDRQLKKLALRSMFALKRHIPMGDTKGGHLRDAVRVDKVLRGGHYKDRTVYEVHAAGSKSDKEKSKWQGALYRSTYTSAADYRRRGAGDRGPLLSWLERAEKDVSGG